MTSVTLVRRIKARPSVLFDLLVTAEGIARWWGPDAGPVLLSESDPRVGGRFRLRFRRLVGDEYETSGEFLEITPPKRVRMTWLWSGDTEASQIEMVLRPIPEGTELTFTHSRLPDDATARGHEKGWSGSLGKLEAMFAAR
jgi:uncharacterized protein YndB with AHSA1/START domain